jgi:hypothetical protein
MKTKQHLAAAAWRHLENGENHEMASASVSENNGEGEISISVA